MELIRCLVGLWHSHREADQGEAGRPREPGGALTVMVPVEDKEARKTRQDKEEEAKLEELGQWAEVE